MEYDGVRWSTVMAPRANWKADQPNNSRETSTLAGPGRSPWSGAGRMMDMGVNLT
jgi:hypothetical protein